MSHPSDARSAASNRRLKIGRAASIGSQCSVVAPAAFGGRFLH